MVTFYLMRHDDVVPMDIKTMAVQDITSCTKVGPKIRLLGGYSSN
jgi:hypothetical protein